MHEQSDDPALTGARRRLSMLAAGLARRFGSDLAAASLAGALVGLVEQEYDREAAVQWLRELANEIEADDSGDDNTGAVPVWQ